jgi:uncharacterized protein (DUF362 family)
MRSVVGLQQVRDYEPEAVLAGMRRCLEPLGGMSAFVRPGQRVLLKPNLLMGARPAKAVTTHPAFVRAAIVLAQEAGARVYVGDSPGVGTLALAARMAGLTAVVEETRAGLLDLGTPMDVEVPDHRVARHLTLARAAMECDVIISLPKLKTHGQMVLSGALKNQYGLIPGLRKSQWHFRLQRPEWLAALILDIHRTARPALAIMDAIVAMEGRGPSAGRPRAVGAILASADLAAVDTLAGLLVTVRPESVPVLVAARAQRFGATRLEELEVVGADWRAMRVPDFQTVSKLEHLLRIVPLPQRFLEWVRHRCTARPRIVEALCQQCGVCAEKCPVSPAAIRPEAPARDRVDDAACIRCYCCHELCPHHAVELAYPLLLRRPRTVPRPN